MHLLAQKVPVNNTVLATATELLASTDYSHNPLNDSSYRVSVISIKGNKKTKLYIVRRELAFQEGDIFSGSDLRERLRTTKENLMNTTLFVTVDIQLDTLLQNEIDINISVKERWYFFPIPYFSLIDRNLNVWVNDYNASLERVNLGLKLQQNNMTGNNDKLNIWIIGGYSQQLSFKYQAPFLDEKLEKGLSLGFNYTRSRDVNYGTDSNKQLFKSFTDFARKSVKADLGFTYRRGSKLRMAVNTSFTYEKVADDVIKLNPNYFGNGRNSATYVDLHYHFQYFNVDYIPYQLRGWYVDLYASNRFSKSLPKFEIGGNAAGTWRFLPKTYINFQGAFVAKLPATQAYYNQKLLGHNPMYLQGLEYYVVDGTWGFVGRTTIKRELFKLNVKNLVRSESIKYIPFRVFLKTYGNLGYGHNKNAGPTNFLNNRLLRTAGFGIDVLTIYDVVFKVEYSYNQFGEKGFFFHSTKDF